MISLSCSRRSSQLWLLFVWHAPWKSAYRRTTNPNTLGRIFISYSWDYIWHISTNYCPRICCQKFFISWATIFQWIFMLEQCALAGEESLLSIRGKMPAKIYIFSSPNPSKVENRIFEKLLRPCLGNQQSGTFAYSRFIRQNYRIFIFKKINFRNVKSQKKMRTEISVKKSLFFESKTRGSSFFVYVVEWSVKVSGNKRKGSCFGHV